MNLFEQLETPLFAGIAVSVCLLLCALTGMLIFKRRWKKSIDQICGLDLDCQMSAIRSIVRESKNKCQRVARELERCIGASTTAESRAGAMNALLCLDRVLPGVLDGSDILSRAIGDAASQVRRTAYSALIVTADAASIELLENRLGAEPDAELRDMITVALATRIKAQVRKQIELEQFDDAERGCRSALTLCPDDKQTQELLAVTSQMRNAKWDRDRLQEREDRLRESSRLGAKAGEQIAHAHPDEAEDLLKRALSHDPSNVEWRAALAALPQLRQELDRNLSSRTISEHNQRLHDLRTKGSELLQVLNYDKAAEVLLKLAALNPEEAWAKQVLATLPQLQEEKRRAGDEVAKTKRAERVNSLRTIITQCVKNQNYTAAGTAVRELLSLIPDSNEAVSLLVHITDLQQKSEADASYAEAQEALSAGDIDAADKALRVLLTRERESERVQAVLQRLQQMRELETGRLREAAEQERTARIVALRESVSRLLAADDFESAEASAKELGSISPGEATDILKHITLRRDRAEADASYAEAQEALSAGDLNAAEYAMRGVATKAVDGDRANAVVARIRAHRDLDNAKVVRDADVQVVLSVRRLRGELSAALAQQKFNEADNCLLQLRQIVPDDASLDGITNGIRLTKERHERDSATRDHIEAAKEAVTRGNLDKAEVELRAVCAFAPDNKDALALLNRLPTLREQVSAKNRFEQQEKEHRECERLTRVHLDAAKSAVASGDLEKAESDLRAVCAVAPDNNDALALLNRLPSLRQQAWAKVRFEQQEKERQRATTAMSQARQLVESGDLVGATSQVRRAIGLDPSNKEATMLLSRIGELKRSVDSEPSYVRENTDAN